MDLAADLTRLVESAATRAAEAVLERGLALVSDLQRRADALLADSELAAQRVATWRTLLDEARKASSETFLARATHVEVGMLHVTEDLRSDPCSGFKMVVFRMCGREFPIVLCSNGFASDGGHGHPAVDIPRGRYTVVVSFYRQGA